MKAGIVFLLVFLVGSMVSSCEERGEESARKELYGTWIWRSSCAGGAGCTYPGVDDYRSLQITSTTLVESANGTVTRSVKYDIKSRWISDTSRPDEVSYELTLDGGALLRMRLLKNRNVLEVENSLQIDSYARP